MITLPLTDITDRVMDEGSHTGLSYDFSITVMGHGERPWYMSEESPSVAVHELDKCVCWSRSTGDRSTAGEELLIALPGAIVPAKKDPDMGITIPRSSRPRGVYKFSTASMGKWKRNVYVDIGDTLMPSGRPFAVYIGRKL